MDSSRCSVDIRQVSKRFSEDTSIPPVLDAISASIWDNEFFTLLGPSGCGKTTLLRAIAGFESVTAGDIFIAGERVTEQPPFARNINTVFQSYALFPHMDVAQNIAFGLEMKGMDKSSIRRRVDEMLELVQLGPLARRRPAELSGGQQQRVALARALAPKPDVLLLDEPLSALDLKLRKEMQVELKRVQEEAGITFIFVTHDQEEALTLSDRIAVMSSGRILQIGTPTEIYEQPGHKFVADFIGEINLLHGSVDKVNGHSVFLPDGLASIIPCLPSAAMTSGSIQLAIRPERIRRAPPGEPYHLDATVETVQYIGTATLYQCRLTNGATIQIRETNSEAPDHALNRGARLALQLPMQACLLLLED